MGKSILKTTIKREAGKLYYCGTDKNGNIEVCEALMARRSPAKKADTKKKAKK
jgi:hypothetical protein